jgi:hypothetical protein
MAARKDCRADGPNLWGRKATHSAGGKIYVPVKTKKTEFLTDPKEVTTEVEVEVRSPVI